MKEQISGTDAMAQVYFGAQTNVAFLCYFVF